MDIKLGVRCKTCDNEDEERFLELDCLDYKEPGTRRYLECLVCHTRITIIEKQG